MENAPYLMGQIAQALGVPLGALKKLGEDGKLTADVITNALSTAAQKIEADFAQMPKTMAGAMQVAQDAAQRLSEQLDNLTGTSAAVQGATTGLGQVLDRLATNPDSGDLVGGDIDSNRVRSITDRIDVKDLRAGTRSHTCVELYPFASDGVSSLAVTPDGMSFLTVADRIGELGFEVVGDHLSKRKIRLPDLIRT
jgi:hypothetical protein